MKLTDNVPLIFFDLETTGVNLFVDRIVELSVTSAQAITKSNLSPTFNPAICSSNFGSIMPSP